MQVINTIIITFISITAFSFLISVLALRYTIEQMKDLMEGGNKND